MGFQYAGNLGGAGAPVVRNMLVGETMYTGQLCQAGITGGIANVQIADAADDYREDDTFPIGFVSGVVDGARSYKKAVSGTAEYGDCATYTVTQSVIADTGPGEIQMTYAIPGITLIKAPIFNGLWGTALAENVIATENTAGTSVIITTTTADFTSKYGTVYCRQGANRGIYRTMTSYDTVTATVTIPFPYTISVGDIYILTGVNLGYSGMQIPVAADCVDGNHVMDESYSVYCHELNLEESGKEYMVFAFWAGTGPEAA